MTPRCNIILLSRIITVEAMVILNMNKRSTNCKIYRLHMLLTRKYYSDYSNEVSNFFRKVVKSFKNIANAHNILRWM